jgi:hypothetical protein
LVLGVAAAAAAWGCGGAPAPPAPRTPFVVPFGSGERYRPRSLSAAVAAARPVGRLRCTQDPAGRATAHVELFAHGLGVVVPAGTGLAPPRRRAGAYVRGGRCSYPLRTTEPTGLVELRGDTRTTLGDLFALLGQPLSRRRMASFRGPVRAWLDGRPWRGAPGALPLRPGGQVVVAVGTQRVPVHAAYEFPQAPSGVSPTSMSAPASQVPSVIVSPARPPPRRRGGPTVITPAPEAP